VTATRRLTFATAKWVVDWVHCDATGLRSNTFPAVAASFTDLDEVSFGVSY
jgi:hypothetical protein